MNTLNVDVSVRMKQVKSHKIVSKYRKYSVRNFYLLIYELLPPIIWIYKQIHVD